MSLYVYFMIAIGTLNVTMAILSTDHAIIVVEGVIGGFCYGMAVASAIASNVLKSNP